MLNRQSLAEAIEEFLESCDIAFIRIFRGRSGIGKHTSVKEFVERLVGCLLGSEMCIRDR